MSSLLTIKGETKSLKRYATSNGFSFSMYNLFKPSMIDVTALGGSWAREDEGWNTLGNKAEKDILVKTSLPCILQEYNAKKS